MHEGQERFLQFFLDAVEPEQQATAKVLLSGAFAKMAAGTFDLVAFTALQGQLLTLVKPEAQDRVKAAMAQFSGTLK